MRWMYPGFSRLLDRRLFALDFRRLDKYNTLSYAPNKKGSNAYREHWEPLAGVGQCRKTELKVLSHEKVCGLKDLPSPHPVRIINHAVKATNASLYMGRMTIHHKILCFLMPFLKFQKYFLNSTFYQF
jgi:hypothetical protein